MKSEDDPWLKNAHANAEHLDREIKTLVSLTNPIREDRPIVTKYQDFWNKAKQITALFKELKPLAKSDRDLLWKQFNTLCGEVKEKQKVGYGTLETLSQQHLDEIQKFTDLAELPPGVPGIHELVERGQALKNAGDTLGRFKHAMIAKHKKACFDRIQAIRKIHDAAWESVKAVKPRQQTGTKFRARKNLEANYERLHKAAGALENFQIGRDHIRTFLATCNDPVKAAKAKIQLTETEARIRDIEEGIRKLKKWIAEDEQNLKEQ
ncbi:MAG: hypothetical protein M0R30_08030 [Methanoregula sp.]|jgi:hypothetical protein|uniref:hypothetical protein n=1 Tax=Methanoregula sp. TaxID=2052170 RepID=UPI0025FEB355|nr:hypothetical protein [Methanoregula sp.]MCK9631578.1 hypothetical protein [Methanoregula sp.]